MSVQGVRDLSTNRIITRKAAENRSKFVNSEMLLEKPQAEIYHPQAASDGCNIYQLYREQSSESSAVKNHINSFVSLGDTLLKQEQVDDLLERYDVDNLSDKDTERLLNELEELGAITKTDKEFALDEARPVLYGFSGFVYQPWVPLEERKTPFSLSMDHICNGKEPISMQLLLRMMFCDEKMDWLTNEENQGVYPEQEQDLQALKGYKQSIEKVSNVLESLKEMEAIV